MTETQTVGIITNTKARVLLDERIAQGDNGFAELRITLVPAPVRGSGHAFKYSLSLVMEGVCELRFDNEAGKGDHYHRGGKELPYRFTTMPELLDEFWRQVEQWRKT